MTTSKVSAPVVGFNHNLKHGGRIYHVQTEDSGLPRAHFITHLYIGGNILASTKGSYSDIVETEDMLAVVRKRMEEQHKQMVRRLVAGEFAESAARFSPHYEPGVLASGHTGPAAVNTASAEPSQAAQHLSPGPLPAALPPTAPMPPAPPPAMAAQMVGTAKVGMPINPAAATSAQLPHPTSRAGHAAVPPAAKPATPQRPAGAPAAHSSATQAPAAHPAPRAPAPSYAAPPGKHPARPPPEAHLAPPSVHSSISADDEEPFVSFDTEPEAPMVRLDPPTSSHSSSSRVPGAPLPSTTRLSPASHRPNVPPRMAPVIPQAPPPAVKPPSISNHPSSPKHASPGRPAPPKPPSMRKPAQPAPPPAISPSIFAAEDRPAVLPHDDLPILFAEELISERSLDEVILAFLSSGSDTENPPK